MKYLLTTFIFFLSFQSVLESVLDPDSAIYVTTPCNLAIYYIDIA